MYPPKLNKYFDRLRNINSREYAKDFTLYITNNMTYPRWEYYKGLNEYRASKIRESVKSMLNVN